MADAKRLLDLSLGECRVRGDDNASEAIAIELTFDGETLRCHVRNTSSGPIRISEFVLSEGRHRLPPETKLHGEGSTMLSQTVGSLENPVDLTAVTDRDYYKLPQPDGWTTLYNMVYLAPPDTGPLLLGFTSSNRFQGSIRLNADRYQIVLDAEGVKMPAGAHWVLDEFIAIYAGDRERIFARYAEEIRKHHAPRESALELCRRGWSSWIAHEFDVSAADIGSAIAALAKAGRSGDIVQLDDGYQKRNGDWLDTRVEFGQSLPELAEQITSAGFEAGIWLAPFVADEDSVLFERHSDWFVKDERGHPIRSDALSFGGWGVNGFWYGLDGSHPAAQEHLTATFKSLRSMGFRHFKLDALYWGTLKGACFYDDSVTRIEAFRRGMIAIREGAGEDAFITAANHSTWACLGLIDASRTSMDVVPTWDSVLATSYENRLRAWQHGRLWQVDPDSVLLAGDDGLHAFDGVLSDDELTFQNTAVFACGGLVLSGDRLASLDSEIVGRLNRFPTTGQTGFHDAELRTGRTQGNGKHYWFALNPHDHEMTTAVPGVNEDDRIRPIIGSCELREQAPGLMATLPPHAGVVLEIPGLRRNDGAGTR